MLRPSRTLSPQARLDIYVDSYMARLIEALEEDFPSLVRYVSHRAFHELGRSYLERHPSRSWSLNPLGRKMADFVGEAVPPSRRGAARDLARLETAMSEVFDAEEATPLGPADFAKIPSAKLVRSRLTTGPALRLLALAHAVNPYVDAVKRGRRLPPIRRRPSWIAVYRKQFRVWRLDLEEPEYVALEALVRGQTVERAVAAAARKWTGTPAALRRRIRRWFGVWASEGFFARLR